MELWADVHIEYEDARKDARFFEVTAIALVDGIQAQMFKAVVVDIV